MRQWMILQFALCAFALLCQTAQARIYKWVDQSGLVHYSDEAPPSAKAKVLTPPALPDINVITSSGQLRHAPKSSEGTAQRARAQRRSSASVQKHRAMLIRRCAHYRHEIEVIEARLRAGYREPQGNRLHAKVRALESARFRECQGV
ncbi:DUF4124 domain-containing protein [Mangrovitalea sediminis]|uniref:DUF4124 domain-containing protein n=1 Tax=Mangrovitalea sediminis TaxID=1982043 RepID=UPI000BE4C82C|nr:DUF4124 domain-containing protein [Mangrovitalea sediminis]